MSNDRGSAPMSWYGDYRPYVSVAERRARAAKEVAKRVKKGLPVYPVSIEGRLIARTFWGQAWCTNLEGYSDYANRLPRGRTYARNGSVVHLEIKKGRIEALVYGSELYTISIDVAPLPSALWKALKQKSAGQIGSLVELLQGKLSRAVMEHVTDRKDGLFPKPSEIKLHCSCPDYAGLCKHLAAVMYGVGNRLDREPQLLFLLRGVNHLELIEQSLPSQPVRAQGKGRVLSTADLGSIFDIEIGDDPTSGTPGPAPRKKSPKAVAKSAPKSEATPKGRRTTKPKQTAKPLAKTAPPRAQTSPTTVKSASTKQASPTVKSSIPAKSAPTATAKSSPTVARPAKAATGKPPTKATAGSKKKSLGD